ncbi:beta-propeller domain-containing protein [Nitrosopumilus ureiphilus]|uniref:Copper amine oxidase n=1 Tax=Nitrosopumilus ureiphilus TaxID=1470067 RepID=A0A7D5M3B0_9ARCH|nr:beta-propeller domain-containing protein [Nitrosopumilus ureiphilus]QLH06146.1 copper amine oxidase [Nitrosopumilus ureiphilus]
MDNKITFSVIAAIIILGSVGMFYAISLDQNSDSSRFDTVKINIPPMTITDTITIEGTNEIRKFSSEEEVRAFLKSFTQEIALDSSFKYPRPTLPPFMEPVNFRESGDATGSIRIPAIRTSASINTGSVSLDRTVYPSPFDINQNSISDYEDWGPENQYSQTNVQVRQVDEPDYIKTDGTFVYVVYDRNLTIIDAYPAEDAKVVSKVSLDIENQNLQNMFLNGERLAIFYSSYDTKETIPLFEIESHSVSRPVTHALIVDVSDKESPKIVDDYSIEGYFFDARMIEEQIYFVTVSNVDYYNSPIPRILVNSETVMTPDVFYFDSFEQSYNFNTITAIDMFDSDRINSETFLMGNTGTLFVSENSLYITYQKNMHSLYYDVIKKDIFFDVMVPMLPKEIQSKILEIKNNTSLDWGQKWNTISDVLQQTFNKMKQNEKEQLISEIQERAFEYQTKIREDMQNTVIHKISLDGSNIEYKAKGEVPGRLLNQFSMDEKDDRFRIATTYEHFTKDEGNRRYNAVYVLDEDLDIVGNLDGIAPDESIFSARFINDRLYLVTFEQIDPFFVIDLSQDTPKILGELKIPGFSNYLHPYDKDHIIGLGKHTEETKNGGVRQLGVKIALFDVSDVKNPKVLDEVIFDNRDSNSAAARDHKAFLFAKRNGILSIPIDQNIKSPSGKQYDFWYGFYVYTIDTENGFDKLGNIKHYDNSDRFDVYLDPRSFYINDVLYTVSSKGIRMNDLDDIQNEINSIGFEPTGKFMDVLK